MKRFILIGIIIFITISSNAFNFLRPVNEAINSSDKDTILALNERAIHYWGINPDTSINMAKRAIALAYESGFNDAKARSYNIAGVAYYKLQKYDTAKLYYDTCIVVGEKYDNHKDLMLVFNNVLVLYYNGLIKAERFEIEGFTRKWLLYLMQHNDYNKAYNFSSLYVFHSNFSDNNTGEINSFLTWYS